MVLQSHSPNRTGVVPPKDVDVILVAPKGSGTSLRTMFLEGRGLNSSYAIEQDYTGHALERTLALAIGIGSGYIFETTFKREAYSDLTGMNVVHSWGQSRVFCLPNMKCFVRTAILPRKHSMRQWRNSLNP